MFYGISLILQRRKVEKELQGTNNLKGPAQATDSLANHVPDAEAKGMAIILYDRFESKQWNEEFVLFVCICFRA